MSLYLGTQLLSGVSTNTISNAHSLFDFIWSDHIKNEMSWLRADTFSWQSGAVYIAAYNHLVADLGTIEQTTYYAWYLSDSSETIFTKTETPSIGDNVYDNSGDFQLLGTVSGIGTNKISYNGNEYSREQEDDTTIQSDTTSSGAVRQTETIGSYTITYWLATDGHKICLPDQETTATNIYNESGVSWYYILDTTNQRFKLPRTKYGFTGLRDTVGNYVEAGLPNITGQFQWANAQSADGCFKKGTFSSGYGQGTAHSDWKGTAIDASLSNSIYGNSITVQPPATQMYLYFYVGQFSQSATEQTAGLNSSLFNGKVDLNASNLSNTGKSLISGLGMPSSRYTDLTLGASGTTYTAPASGMFLFSIKLDSNKYFAIFNENYSTVSDLLDIVQSSFLQNYVVRCFVKKGHVIRIQYDAVYSNNAARFYYAEGEV